MLECTYNTNSSDGFSPSLRDNFFESPKSGQLFLSPITTVNHNNNVCAVQQMLIYIFSPILWQFLGKIIQQMTGFSDCWLAIYTLFDDWFQTPHVVLQWPIHAFFLISKNADFFHKWLHQFFCRLCQQSFNSESFGGNNLFPRGRLSHQFIMWKLVVKITTLW